MSTKNKKEDALIKAIKRGDFKNCYIEYNRKSLDEPDSQKNSLEYQKIENARLEKGDQLKIANITIEGFCKNGRISEKHSSFKEGDELTITEDGLVQYRIERPKFQRLLHYLSRGYFKGVVCLPCKIIADLISLRENHEDHLFAWKRTQALKHIKQVMAHAEISKVRATARALRHTFATHAIRHSIPLTMLQRWLGRASIETTAIYTQILGPEERKIAEKMW